MPFATQLGALPVYRLQLRIAPPAPPLPHLEGPSIGPRQTGASIGSGVCTDGIGA